MLIFQGECMPHQIHPLNIQQDAASDVLQCPDLVLAPNGAPRTGGTGGNQVNQKAQMRPGYLTFSNQQQVTM